MRLPRLLASPAERSSASPIKRGGTWSPNRQGTKTSEVELGRMLKRRRKEKEVITVSDDMHASSDSDLPGWLPDGWDRASRRDNNGNLSFFYPCPTCVGITLRTQDEVLRHCLFSCEDAPLKSQLATPRQLLLTNDSSPLKDGQKSESSAEGGQFGNRLFDSIPSGWTIEIRRGPRKNGKNYKFYVDPTKVYRFSSKEEVLFYLKEGKPLYAASNEILYCDTKGEDNMVAELIFSPKTLPYGWIKETKYRHNYATSKNGIRKDQYYIDPESGRVFRSLKEVERYLQIGKVEKQARVRRRSFADIYCFETSLEMPEHLLEGFGPSILTSGQTSKRPMDGDGEVQEKREEDLMRPTDGVLLTSVVFMKGGTEHECLTNVGTIVGTETEIVGRMETITTVEENQRKEGDSTEFQEGHRVE